jgi:hypothetical protein
MHGRVDKGIGRGRREMLSERRTECVGFSRCFYVLMMQLMKREVVLLGFWGGRHTQQHAERSLRRDGTSLFDNEPVYRRSSNEHQTLSLELYPGTEVQGGQR